MDSTAQPTMDLCVEMVERRRQDNPRPPLKSSERLLNALQLVQCRTSVACVADSFVEMGPGSAGENTNRVTVVCLLD